jgi:translocation and assembly module TamB
VLDSLWPQVERIGGRFDAHLTLGGLVGEPRFEGDFSLRDAALSWTLMGVGVEDLQLEGTVNAADQLQFKGPFRMGEGLGNLQGSLDFSNQLEPQWQVRVTGERLRVADLPTLRIDVDPDVSLAWLEGSYEISGSLLVPSARIAPSSSVFSRVTESGDIRVVAGQLPDAVEPEQDQAANLLGQLEVTLGDDVRLDMQNIEAALTGALALDWPNVLIPNAKGQVVVNGEVRVFGPVLHIYNGRVRFNDGPVDDPGLSIRAVRDIFGNTQVQTAGVMVSGTAQKPEIEAYTNPLTTRERAWALLITGQDFEYGQGVGAFDIGTYIAPRLYVSYGLSLFDDSNVVSARYDLRRGFGIKATSSQTENGLDVSYTVNRGRSGDDE